MVDKRHAPEGRPHDHPPDDDRHRDGSALCYEQRTATNPEGAGQSPRLEVRRGGPDDAPEVDEVRNLRVRAVATKTTASTIVNSTGTVHSPISKSGLSPTMTPIIGSSDSSGVHCKQD